LLKNISASATMEVTGLPAPLRESVMCPRGDIFFMAELKPSITRLKDLINNNLKIIKLEHIGFPNDWETKLLKQSKDIKGR